MRIIASYAVDKPHRKVELSHIEVSRIIEATPGAVWEELSDMASHGEWMKDARVIGFAGDQRRGVGTCMEVETRIGPLATRDLLEVTGWVEGRSIRVAHRGTVRGEGELSVADDPSGSIVTWRERLVFPWWLGGAVTAWLARPVLAAVWRRNLARLAGLVSFP